MLVPLVAWQSKTDCLSNQEVERHAYLLSYFVEVHRLSCVYLGVEVVFQSAIDTFCC